MGLKIGSAGNGIGTPSVRVSRCLYFALGFLSAAAMPAAAERIITECRLVVKPDLPPCDNALIMHFRYGNVPHRCRVS